MRPSVRLLGVLLVGAAACAAPGAWQRPGAGPDQVAFDLQGCRSEARARMEDSLYHARERTHFQAQQAAAIGRSDELAVARRWQEQRERRDRAALIEDCMIRKGYHRQPASAGGRAAGREDA